MGNGADELKALVRTIPDFPKPGVRFRDITTLLLDRDGLTRAVDFIYASWRREAVEVRSLMDFAGD